MTIWNKAVDKWGVWQAAQHIAKKYDDGYLRKKEQHKQKISCYRKNLWQLILFRIVLILTYQYQLLISVCTNPYLLSLCHLTPSMTPLSISCTVSHSTEMSSAECEHMRIVLPCSLYESRYSRISFTPSLSRPFLRRKSFV